MAHEPFRGAVPDGLLYDPHHDMWVRPAATAGEVEIGITAFGLFLAGEIIAFTAKPAGARIACGRGLGTVESRKTVFAVHAPLGFVLVAANEALEAHPQPINADPHAAWLVRGRPLDWNAEAAALVDAAAYRAHVRCLEPAAEFR